MVCLIWITSGCRWKAMISFNLCICKSCEVMNFKDAECNAGKWYQVTRTFFKVSSLLKEIDLADQRDTLSKDLSGGQKRKLSVGIALIGDPKVYTCTYLLTCKCYDKPNVISITQPLLTFPEDKYQNFNSLYCLPYIPDHSSPVFLVLNQTICPQ